MTTSLLLVALALGLGGLNHDCWELQSSGSTASLRGVSAVNDTICWASGAGGTVLRTTDGGTTWHNVSPTDHRFLRCDFRDVHAFDEHHAVIMSAGDPDILLLTEDGGAHWQVVFEHPRADAFLDGIAFWNRQRGLLMGDPIDGRLVLAVTADGGRTWANVPDDARPQSEAGEGGFAASGTNVCALGNGWAWIGLGGTENDAVGARALIWRTRDFGATWVVSQAPLSRSASSGVFSIAAASETELVAVGGDYLNPDRAIGNVALSADGGITWLAPKNSVPRGYRSAVAVVPGTNPTQWIATGPNGTDTSHDSGNSWHAASEHGFHALSFASSGAGWGVGSEGRVAKFRPH